MKKPAALNKPKIVSLLEFMFKKAWSNAIFFMIIGNLPNSF